MSMVGLAFKAGRLLGLFRMVFAIAIPMIIAGAVAWFWSTASSAGRAKAEVEILAEIAESNRLALVRAEAGQAELAEIAREAVIRAADRERLIARFEDSLATAKLEVSVAEARAEAAASGNSLCPAECIIPEADWPWMEGVRK